MSTRAQVQAYLGMNVSGFQAGLQKANGLLAAFQRGFKSKGLGGAGSILGGFGGGLATVAGLGALIVGFRGVMRAAQDAREEAKQLGTEISVGTRAVATYADAWDSVKEAIKGVAIEATGKVLGGLEGTAVGKFVKEEAARAQSKAAQKQTEADLKATDARQKKEGEQLAEQLASTRRENRLAEMSDTERMTELMKEQDALWERRASQTPGSLAAKRTELEIEKKIAEVRQLQEQIDRKKAPLPSEMSGKTPFGMTLGEVASSRPEGRRSERERLAAQAMKLEERGRGAEAAGRFGLAKDYRDRAAEMARNIGLGDMESSVRRGGVGGQGGAAAGQSWDSKYGAQLSARNAALNARYGGDFTRPESFESATAAREEEAAGALKDAAAKLESAGEALRTAVITVEVEGD